MKSEPQNRRPSFIRTIDPLDIVALSLGSVFFFVGLYILVKKYVNFGYYDWDLAIYANAMWNLSHGSFHPSLFGTNFLTNHAEYLSFFLVPIYLVFPSAFTLVVLKLLSFIAGSFVFYLIAKRVLGGPMAILLMLMYQFHPANLSMLIYEFHFENFATIFIFLIFYFFFRESLIPFLASAFFASLVKENIPLIVFMFGIYAIFTKRPRKAAWVTGPLIIGGGVFILAMFVITPHLRMLEGIPTANQYIGMYWNHQDKTVPLTTALWQNLGTAFGNFSSRLNMGFMIQLFGTFGILPFLSPHILFLGLPIFSQNFLTSVWQMHTIDYHYAATMMPFIFLAVMTTLSKLRNRFRPIFCRLILILLIAVYFLQMSVHLPRLKDRMAAWQDRLDPMRWQMVNSIPPAASVMATFDFLDKLADRKDLYSFHNVWRDRNPFTSESPYRIPQNLSLALIDWECPWFWADVFSEARSGHRDALRHASDFYFQGGWTVKEATEGITLLGKGFAGNLPPLVEVSRDAPLDLPANPVLSVDNKFSLLDFTVGQKQGVTPKRKIPLTFLWKASEDMDDFYSMVIELKNGKETVFRWYRHIGYGIYATPLWKKGDYITERYWVLLPSGLPPAHYTFEIFLIREQN